MLDARELTVELDVEAGVDGAVVRALDALSLSIERGETFALVGESGCGKSMTALALMRLLPDNGRVTAGRIAVDEGREPGVDWLDLPEAAMRRVRGGRIGMIFQEPATSLNPVMRVVTRSSRPSRRTPRCAARPHAPRPSTGCAGSASRNPTAGSTSTRSA